MFKIRKAIKYLAKPRQFMYLLALLVVVWIHAFYLIYKYNYLAAEAKTERNLEKYELSLNKTMQIDINTGRMAYDGVFDPDEAIRDKTVGTFERFINICDRATCRVISGLNPTIDVCNKELSTSRTFHKYRVYSCSLKITVENNEPMNCTRVNWSDVKGFCEKLNDT